MWLLLLLLEAPAGTAVNLGSDVPISILELAQRVRTLVHPTLKVFASTVAPSRERQHYVPSIRQARALGLEVWTDLDQSIRRTALWYRQHTGGGKCA